LIGRNLAYVSLKIARILAKIVQQPDRGAGRAKPYFRSGPSRRLRDGRQVIAK
jgi:hypothetical protein